MRILGLLLLSCTLLAAQPRGGGPGGGGRQDQRFAESGLSVGDPFPHVDVHDAAGEKVNTSSLNGFFTVVVSGCLT